MVQVQDIKSIIKPLERRNAMKCSAGYHPIISPYA